jgi:hypothetical protein
MPGGRSSERDHHQHQRREPQESAVQRVERAARAELEDVRLVPVVDPGEACSPAAVRNVVVLGTRGPGG